MSVNHKTGNPFLTLRIILNLKSKIPVFWHLGGFLPRKWIFISKNYEKNYVQKYFREPRKTPFSKKKLFCAGAKDLTSI